MLFSKIARQIIALAPVVAVAISLPLKDVGEFFSGALPRDKLASIIFLAFFYLLILSIYLSLYKLFLNKLHLSVSLRLKKRGERAVYQEKIARALFAVRLRYLLTRVYEFLDLRRAACGNSDENKVWEGLNKKPISKIIAAIFEFLFSLRAFTSLALSCISLGVFSLSNLSVDRIQGLMLQSLNFRVDLVDLVSKLPLVATLLALVPTVFFFYFYSQKRDVRKIIDKERNKRLEESVLLYEELMLWIDKNLYNISDNYVYVFGVQKLIVSLRVEKRAPNFSLTGLPPNRGNKINNFQFIELPEADDFAQVANDLLSDKLHRYSSSIAYGDYDLWNLYQELSSLKDPKEVRWSFYTRTGVEDYISAFAKLADDIDKEMLEEERKNESSILASDIYKKLELLYALKRGSDAIRKYLYSSKTEKVLVRVLQKEK